MATIKIDNTDYDIDSLSVEAKNNLQMLKITEQEIQRLQSQLAIAQTARVAYGKALKKALPQSMDETISFSGLEGLIGQVK